MHAAGQVVACILAAVRDQAVPGVRLDELDATARDVLAEAHATSPFLGYQPSPAQSPYPAVICASVNDAALHDIPGRYRLADGDLLSVDCGATLDGWAADAAISVQVGRRHPADTCLIDTAARALGAGIAAAVPGGRLGDISAAIGAVGRSARYGICTDFGGQCGRPRRWWPRSAPTSTAFTRARPRAAGRPSGRLPRLPDCQCATFRSCTRRVTSASQRQARNGCPISWCGHSVVPGRLGGWPDAGAVEVMMAAHPRGRAVAASHGDVIPVLLAALSSAFAVTRPHHGGRGGWYT